MLKRAVALTLVVAAGIIVPAANADRSESRAGGNPPPVKVLDDFFAPTTLNVSKNDKVKFKWDPSNTDSHNVTLQKGPKGVKKGCPTKGKDAFSPLISKCNKSGTGAIGIKFAKKFDVKGTYQFVCTIHPDVMKLTVKVGK
jgi:plastocyanin